MDCQCFSGGFQVVCRSDGTTPAGPMQGLAVYGYDAEAKMYTATERNNTGSAGSARFDSGQDVDVFVRLQGGGKP